MNCSIRDDEAVDAALSRALHGDADAFGVVVRRWSGPLRRWVASHAPPGVDPDDVAQASFVAAYTRLEEFTPGTNFAGWLFTIARYQLRTETTRLRRLADYHHRHGPDLLAKELERRREATLDEHDERVDHLADCLGDLAPERQALLAWRYDEGIPVAEMAARSNRSVMAIKKQLWMLRGQLRACIEGKLGRAAR